VNADQIGIGLKGRRNVDGWLVRCPCPNHGKGRGDTSPSLSVHDGEDGRLLLRCFAGCEFLDILDALKRLGLVGDIPSLNRARPAIGRFQSVQSAPHEPDPAALAIWRNAKPTAGTIVAEYLERRGIPLNPPPSLRCCTVMHLTRYEMPAMIAGVQAPDGKVIAVQATTLTPKGTKAPITNPRITTGALGAGAVRFAAAAEVTGLAEGIESALSAQILAKIPVWASLGCKRLHRVELPDVVREVHVFGDNDEPGRAAAKVTAEVHARLGRKVKLRFPPEGIKDFNDLLLAIADCDGDEDRLMASLQEFTVSAAA
jgi:putative DNA primase/helicase